ncbi:MULTISPECIES: peptidylprolyl isomerase [Bacillota]|jgi:peptidyl-prolyl cis-trans isomerase B (cyclophilin B)|uniref:Peptidyl-prolyl cis-trans isomerase n=2 Tax=Amedibacillus TaxID=2749846 RepID=A0A7G9GPJ6_9FIRM|nr:MULTISPECIES: peptidylprolyl isomerase [Bacillota]QNM12728.1 peptidylprolyl isomerase [[Eubacterium] hominis]MCH4286944.1 peptidylprolyl isomerase [Amedibacillus hominis]RGB48429.1 peptidylprolyl isomerase [Absiella sp. AM22-9]RGB51427.1 peptidylprolyl isomerase [Absiella sp. AM10-20]RGB60877.1 peptidylprolyl isomerase [Absiella sp. AM09-45]
MRKVISVCMMICFMLTISACGTKETPKPTEQVSENLLKGKHHAVIDVKDYGTIELELDADTAPITVTNFVELAKDGFYDGLTFHRNIEDFMIQGGDPNGNGTGGSKHTIKGEFSANGVENNIKHERGVISMARSQDYNSASSQFFIMYEKASHLDGQYAAFGKVTKGLDVLDKLEKVKAIDNNGLVEASQQPVINSIKILD